MSCAVLNSVSAVFSPHNHNPHLWEERACHDPPFFQSVLFGSNGFGPTVTYIIRAPPSRPSAPH